MVSLCLRMGAEWNVYTPKRVEAIHCLENTV